MVVDGIIAPNELRSELIRRLDAYMSKLYFLNENMGFTLCSLEDIWYNEGDVFQHRLFFGKFPRKSTKCVSNEKAMCEC